MAESQPRSQRGSFLRWSASGCEEAVDELVEEMPLALVYNGISHAVMLATPADLEDFAVGFSMTEGVVDHVRQIYDVEAEPAGQGIELRVHIAAARMAALKERRRTLAGRTGCGLCGVESLADALRPARPVPAGGRLSVAALDRACDRLAACQPLHRLTGASHAAAFADWSGELRLVREDVGRHNALDKLAGALARSRTEPASGFVLVTSRASVEMVNKTAAAGIGLLAALSAPTGLAVREAERAGLTLVGFAGRGQRWVYANAERIESAGEREEAILAEAGSPIFSWRAAARCPGAA